ncbi:helix-turn-helix domain-containing protein [Paenibacillus oceani]|uniref:AraC family transcriptional regulator n=1 Tax=Paenibacillus oceani TaxID=2772510 RepID=A0A927H184_9BACL|nr:helix-turn-helix domain-containing protein [Paenibacillus oceani]MBD2864500.1 AraC family transcriptional regulator [Paenibacillus oceani]
MNISQSYRSRKYLFTILLSVSVLLIVVLIGATVTLYANTEKTVLRIQQSANEKMLSQTVYSVDSANELVKNAAISAYFDPDVNSLMNDDITQTYMLYQHIGGLERVAKSFPFLHSVAVYNSVNGCYYSYAPNAILPCTTEGINGTIDQYRKANPDIPKLKLIPVSTRPTPDGQSEIDFFSYFLFGSKASPDGTYSAVIVNVKPDWLFAQLEAISKLNGSGSGRLLLMNGDGYMYDPEAKRWTTGDGLSHAVRERMSQTGTTANLFVSGSGSSKSIVSYMASKANDWSVVSLQPYDQVFRDILRMRWISFSLIGLFLLLSLAGSVLISFKLYRPIEMLLRTIRGQLRETAPGPEGRKDEWAYISGAFQTAIGKMQALVSEQHAQGRIVQTYLFKKWITDSGSLSPLDIIEIEEQLDFRLGERSKLLAVQLVFDNYREFAGHVEERDRSAYKFAVSNIAGEMLSSLHRTVVIDMSHDHLVALIRLDDPEASWTAPLLAKLGEIQDTVQRYYHISLTAAVSSTCDQYRDVSRLYGQTIELAKYKLIFGRRAVITPESVEPNRLAGQYEPSPALEKKLAEALKSGSRETASACIDEWFGTIRRLHSDHMMYGLFHLSAVLSRTFGEMNASRVQQLPYDSQQAVQRLVAAESLDEAKRYVLDAIGEALKSSKATAAELTHRLMIDTVKEMVDTRYADPAFCLQQVATAVRMSPAHASKLFKLQVGLSIPEYITEVRLHHALRLLVQEEYSVNTVMEKVGFDNQSYFFRLFKKKFGTTPKEYRMKNVLY